MAMFQAEMPVKEVPHATRLTGPFWQSRSTLRGCDFFDGSPGERFGVRLQVTL